MRQLTLLGLNLFLLLALPALIITVWVLAFAIGLLWKVFGDAVNGR